MSQLSDVAINDKGQFVELDHKQNYHVIWGIHRNGYMSGWRYEYFKNIIDWLPINLSE